MVILSQLDVYCMFILALETLSSDAWITGRVTLNSEVRGMEVHDEALLSFLGRGNGNRQQDMLPPPPPPQLQHKFNINPRTFLDPPQTFGLLLTLYPKLSALPTSSSVFSSSSNFSLFHFCLYKVGIKTVST